MKSKKLYDDLADAVIRAFRKGILEDSGVDIAEADLKRIFMNALKGDWTFEMFFGTLDELIKKRKAN